MRRVFSLVPIEVITVHDERGEGTAVLALALKSGCGAYDCEFVWLASHLRVPLVTADKRILAAFPSVALSIEAFPSGMAP